MGNDQAKDPELDFGHGYWRGANCNSEDLPDLSGETVSDAEFRLLAENIPTLCWLARGDGYIVWYNRRWYEYTGTKPEEMEGWGWQSTHDPEQLPLVLKKWQTSIATGQPFEMTFPLRGADGVFRPFLTRVQPICDASGNVARWFGVNTDVSDAARAEEALREESLRLETLNRTGVALASELDLERVVQRVTDAGVALVGAKFGAFFYNVIGETGEKYLLYTLSGADRSEFAQFGMPRNTAVFGPTFRGEGMVRSNDITTDLRYGKNEPHQGMPKGHLPVKSYLAVPVISRSGEVIGGLFFGHPEPSRFTKRHEDLMEGLAGQAAIAIDNAKLFQAAQRELESRRETEQRLSESEDRLRVATEAAQIGTWDFNLTTRELRWDARCKQLFGLPSDAEITYEGSFLAGLHAEDRERTRIAVEDAITPGGAGEYNIEYRTVGLEDGMERWIAASGRAFFAEGNPVRFIGTVVDISQRKRTEDALRELNENLEQKVAEEVLRRLEAEGQLRQAQKMEAVGQLTGGVAHDFNNLLTVIMGGLDTLRRSESYANPRTRRATDMALQAVGRAASLTARLLAFSRRQPLDPKPLDLNALMRDMTELLYRTLGETIELEAVLAPRLWTVELDQNQMESAIINLAVNARDAMPAGGRLTIETANALLDERYAETDREVVPGQYAMLAISDTGCGISRETLTRVFEPFFTTKESGRGTGLGLSMVYGFVKQSGGHVTIYSEQEHGTTVKMYFPRHQGTAGRRVAEAMATVPPQAIRDEVILVVEDNEDVRAYSAMVLSELGYKVLEAANAEQAMEVLAKAPRVDLLFTDVVLPGKNGRVLADEAKARWTSLRVLYTTGYSRNAITHHGRLNAGVQLITKPFAPEELAARVRDALDRS